MRLHTMTVVYAAIFALTCVFSQVFTSDLYCFSCFGYDRDDASKCLSRDGGNLFVRKCTSNTSCIKYTARYKVPQMSGERLVDQSVKVRGVHCGTIQQCERNECPNFWPNDIKVENCKVDCCDPRRFTCPPDFLLPNEDDIKRYNNDKDIKDNNNNNNNNNNDDDDKTTKGSDAATIAWSVWLQAVSFAIFGWFKL